MKTGWRASHHATMCIAAYGFLSPKETIPLRTSFRYAVQTLTPTITTQRSALAA